MWRLQRRKTGHVALGAAWVSLQAATIGSVAICARRSAEGGENESGTLVHRSGLEMVIGASPIDRPPARKLLSMASSHVHPVANFFVSSCMIDDDFMKMMLTACVHV
ncbi:unnamed protein product [Trichogramma brassicae]|uniref:Uncharacterized protein n=1 Tax=Trichogramma brassicae TaxID=86971 RepID=A0A6H5IX38_9HYME|nr:unnamed protein product [Trichogramma brassicae]